MRPRGGGCAPRWRLICHCGRVLCWGANWPTEMHSLSAFMFEALSTPQLVCRGSLFFGARGHAQAPLHRDRLTSSCSTLFVVAFDPLALTEPFCIHSASSIPRRKCKLSPLSSTPVVSVKGCEKESRRSSLPFPPYQRKPQRQRLP